MKTWLAGEDDDVAWMVSLLLHLSVIVFLAFAFTASRKEERSIAVIEVPLSEPEVELSEVVVSEEPTEASEVPQQPEMEQVPISSFAELTVDSPASFFPESTPSESVPEEVLNSNLGTQARPAFADARGADGAVDILAAEIDSHLERRPTVVCWVFDQSVSLVAQRNGIAARLDRVFMQIKNPGLMNVVFSYGQKVNFVVKSPIEDPDVVSKAILDIPVDESGVEMTFTAIRSAAEASKAFSSNPKNSVMIVVFTDEVGNDGNLADSTSRYCRNLGIPVYVVGVPAPFGTKDVKIKYVEFDPNFQQYTTWAVVNQGPESLYPEFVRLAHDEEVDSGFGPYQLSRVCADTGGIYFRVHANGGKRIRVSDEETAPMASRLRMFFDPQVMRGYKPDYSSPQRIEHEISGNRAKKALVTAAAESAVHPLESQQTVFPRRDEASFAALLSEAQKTAAKIQPKIDAICEVLLSGLNDRPKIKEKRWQAGYDLSLGRILATKVRADAYNITLAQAKSGMKFKEKDSDTWELVPSEKLSVGSQTEKKAEQAKILLEKVVTEHPGTPWAYYAEQELKTPMGYEWVERHTGVNKKDMDGGSSAPPPRDDRKKMIAPPKPRRDLKNL